MGRNTQNLRMQMKIIGQGISSGDRRAATKAIADIGEDFLSSGGHKVIAGFIPVGDEITPLLLMQALYHRQQKLALPKWQEGGAVRYFSWWPGESLEGGSRGIPEPLDTEQELQPDFLMVPVLGYDQVGNRLGFGNGNYREAIEGLRARGDVIVVGVGFSQQALPVPLEDDIDGRLDWMLTQHGIRRMAN